MFLNIDVNVIYDCNISLEHRMLILSLYFNIICVLCKVFLNMKVHVIDDCNIRH